MFSFFGRKRREGEQGRELRERARGAHVGADASEGASPSLDRGENRAGSAAPPLAGVPPSLGGLRIRSASNVPDGGLASPSDGASNSSAGSID